MALMQPDFLSGALVRLVAPDPARDAELLAAWSRDSEYMRLSSHDLTRPLPAATLYAKLERDLDDEAQKFSFMIQLLQEERRVGYIALHHVDWLHREGWVGISLGERALWGRGYGSDAMRVLLRYAFGELGLHRVSLGVYEYNPRAMRAYEKVGFVVEGRVRRAFQREGRAWDEIHMGILASEWQRQQQPPPAGA